MANRKPVGPAGRGPRRKYYTQDFELWTHAKCGRVLPEGYLDMPGSTGPKTPKNPGNPPGQGPGKQGPIPPAPPTPPRP